MRAARTLDTRSAQEAWTPVVSSLLTGLSIRWHGWTILKNHERLPVVTGDIDTCLAPARWDDFVETLVDAVAPWGAHAIVACDHYVGVRLVFVASIEGGARTPLALEIDLADGVWWKGTRLAPASSIEGASVLDPRGFRRSRDGWEAAVLLTRSAIGREGGLRTAVVDARRIREKAAADVEGFRSAMNYLHGPRGGIAAGCLLEDRWSPGVGRALMRDRMKKDPLRWPARSIAFARRKAMRHWRGLPREIGPDPEGWLKRVGRGHRCRVVQGP